LVEQLIEFVPEAGERLPQLLAHLGGESLGGPVAAGPRSTASRLPATRGAATRAGRGVLASRNAAAGSAGAIAAGRRTAAAGSAGAIAAGRRTAGGWGVDDRPARVGVARAQRPAARGAEPGQQDGGILGVPATG
jgi:hypothetical protein